MWIPKGGVLIWGPALRRNTVLNGNTNCSSTCSYISEISRENTRENTKDKCSTTTIKKSTNTTYATTAFT